MANWDAWRDQALSVGVSAELAQLGREILRDHCQHGHDLVPDPGVWRMADRPDYMLRLAKEAPQTAFHDFSAHLIWAAGQDGEVAAFSLLVERHGSEDAADAALEGERPVVDRLRAELLEAA